MKLEFISLIKYYSRYTERPNQNVRRRSETFDDGRPSEESFGERSGSFGNVRDRSESTGLIKDESVGKAAHNPKINIWAGISRNGPTKLIIFNGML